MIARAFKADLTPNERVYVQFVVMQIMLAKIAPGNHWAQKLREMLAEHPAIPIVSMGFPADWASRKIWAWSRGRPAQALRSTQPLSGPNLALQQKLLSRLGIHDLGG
jgi:hypothetical protein